MVSRDVHFSAGVFPTVDDVVEVGTLAEELQYDHIWVPETWGLDAVTTLALLADRTDRVGLGSGIVNTYSRTPALLGQTAATLQSVADGRFRLGLGPSSSGVVEDWHGVPFERPLRRTREAIEIVNRVTTGDLVGYDGEIFGPEGAMRLRSDAPNSRPPIDIAALGPKAVELAGRFGDGWCAFLFSPEGMRNRLEDFRRGAALGDRDPDNLRVLQTVVCCALSDGDRARDLVRKELSLYIGMMGDYYAESVRRQGYAEAVDRIVSAWAEGRHREAVEAVDDNLLDEFVAAGTPERARSELEKFAAVDGVDAIAVGLPHAANRTEIEETIASLAPT